MKVIFATTNKRKVEDLENLIKMMNLDIEVLSLNDIGFTDEVEETGTTLEENSLIKASSIHEYCIKNYISFPIISDDAGLFVDYLNGLPGVYTGRYADNELSLNPNLPKHYCVNKLLNELNGIEDSKRTATYRCVVTCMFPDGNYFQESGESKGYIATEIGCEIKRPYFYCIFVLSEYNKIFGTLNEEELNNTYRYKALRLTLSKLNDKK